MRDVTPISDFGKNTLGCVETFGGSMAAVSYKDVRTILAEANSLLRSSLKAGLFPHGIREVVTVKDAKGLIEALNSEIIDLVICDQELPGLDLLETTRLIRQGQLGRNPFVLIIATVTDSAPEHVQKIIDSGVDDVLRKPVSIDALIDRIESLGKVRKPFVANYTYVGPARRFEGRPEEEGETILHVPNTLRSKISNKASGEMLQTMIENAMAQLEDMKVQSSFNDITRVVKRVRAYYEDKWSHDSEWVGDEAQLLRDLDYLIDLASEISARNRGTRYNHVADVADGFTKLIKRIRVGSSVAQKKDVELLSNLAEVVRRSMSADESLVGTVQEIAATISRLTDFGADQVK